MTRVRRGVPVIDLFAGPGGLGEGFSSLLDSRGTNVFEVRLSIECEPSAHRTLTLRSFFRQFPQGDAPEEYYEFVRGLITREALFDAWPTQANSALREAWNATLGQRGTHAEVDRRIRQALAGEKHWVLIGGPPCQAYSLIGRSRNQGIKGYKAESDRRHFLYREYLRIVATHRPAVFVMENVRGLLTSKVSGEQMFDRILNDLREPLRAGGASHRRLSYSVVPIEVRSDADTADSAERYIVRAEQHGVPQARHRVILVGIRNDIDAPPPRLPIHSHQVSVRDVIGDLPRLRSGLSVDDSSTNWRTFVSNASRMRKTFLGAGVNSAVVNRITSVATSVTVPRHGRGGLFIGGVKPAIANKSLSRWVVDSRIAGIANHETRAHMDSDVYRYLFASAFAAETSYSPRLKDFPVFLLPKHQSAKKSLMHRWGYFSDRFRVQLADEPATTITSHIAKDGHYYIHYDPRQCRSLTVREAARIQTFPDNYFFCGNRTEQYTQVGNAVPPFLAMQIARAVSAYL